MNFPFYNPFEPIMIWQYATQEVFFALGEVVGFLQKRILAKSMPVNLLLIDDCGFYKSRLLDHSLDYGHEKDSQHVEFSRWAC